MEIKILFISTIIYAYVNRIGAQQCSTALASAQLAGFHVNSFAVRLYQRLIAGESSENLLFSPVSISQSLALLESGAAGATKSELATFLTGPNVIPGQTAIAHQSLQSYLRKSNAADVLFTLANGIYVDKQVQLQPTYQNSVVCFNAVASIMNFQTCPESSRRKVNKFVAKMTMDKIPELLKRGTVTSGTSTVVVNAVYLKSTWMPKPEIEEKAPFTPASGPVQEVKYMSFDSETVLSKPFPYGTIVKIPLLQGFEFYVMLSSDTASVSDVGNWLTTDRLRDLLHFDDADLLIKRPMVFLPMFTTRSTLLLKNTLMQLGLKTPFDQYADFSAMVNGQLILSEVAHEAYIKVDEKGLEAAAASAGLMEWKIGGPPQELWINKSFTYFVKHENTGAVVFVGRVNRIEDN